MNYDPSLLLPELAELGTQVSLVVALSGGLDSMVLLESLASLAEAGLLDNPLSALHVHHGLSSHADEWLAFCATACQQRGIPFSHARVALDTQSGDSIEELARRARYRVFSRHLSAGQCLLMAHQQDDQLEHLLLRLARGSGPGGLAGIPRARSLGAGQLLRPLLGFQRRQLLEFARFRSLSWIEDEANQSPQFDRNFWRNEILPRIEKRFPGYRRSWLKSMALCGEAEQLCGQLARQDLAAATPGDPRILDLAVVLPFDAARQRNLLRHWMLVTGFTPPGWQLMRRLSDELLISNRHGAHLNCGDGTVARYGNRLVLLAHAPDLPCSPCGWNPVAEPELTLECNGSLRARFSDAGGSARKLGGAEAYLRYNGEGLRVGYPAGGEMVRLAGRPVKSLRKLLQDSTLPPWLRRRQPLVYCGDRVACIPGIGVAEEFCAGIDEAGIQIHWLAPDLLFRPTVRTEN